MQDEKSPYNGKEEPFCRICMDDGSSAQLISPCRCSGSLKYIHEECLKTWLASKDQDMDQAKCEICNTVFLMRMVLSKRCAPRNSLQDGLTHCLFMPLLLGVFGMLVLIVYMLLDTLLEGKDDGDEKGYSVALMIICSLSALVILSLIANSFKEACVSNKLQEWKIFDQEFEPPCEVVPDEQQLKLFQSQSITEIPKVIRVRGHKVRTENSVTPIRSRATFSDFRRQVTSLWDRAATPVVPVYRDNDPADNNQPEFECWSARMPN